MMKYITLVRSGLLGTVMATAEANTVDASTIMDILTAVTSQFSITAIVGIIAGILGVTMAFVFLWWGIRKGASAIISAVKTGKFKI